MSPARNIAHSKPSEIDWKYGEPIAESPARKTGDLTQRELLDRYERHIYKQWLRVYMRSKMIKHNKDLFESLDDPLALLEKLHI